MPLLFFIIKHNDFRKNKSLKFDILKYLIIICVIIFYDTYFAIDN